MHLRCCGARREERRDGGGLSGGELPRGERGGGEKGESGAVVLCGRVRATARADELEESEGAADGRNGERLNEETASTALPIELPLRAGGEHQRVARLLRSTCTVTSGREDEVVWPNLNRLGVFSRSFSSPGNVKVSSHDLLATPATCADPCQPPPQAHAPQQL